MAIGISVAGPSLRWSNFENLSEVAMTSARALPTLLLVAILVFSASPLYAGSNASTNLSVTNFTITPDAGSVLFTAPWDGEASATAQDTSDPLQKHQFSSGFGKLVQANATTLLASGQASADAINL